MPLTSLRMQQALDSANCLTTMTLGTAPLHIRYMTAVGSVTAAGTELTTGGGYTQGAGAPTVTMAAASGSAPASSASTTAVTTTNMPATTINGVEGWDSAGSPVRQWLGSLTTPRSPASGDTLSFAIGAIVTQMS